VIAVANFIPAFEEENDEKELKSVSNKTRQLYDLMMDSHCGIPVYVVRLELVTSTDDSTVYIIKGHSCKPDVFCFVTKVSCATKGKKSVYNIDDSNTMCGMRVGVAPLRPLSREVSNFCIKESFNILPLHAVITLCTLPSGPSSDYGSNSQLV